MAKNQILTLTVRIAGQMDRSLTATLGGVNSTLSTVTRSLSRIGTVGLAAVGALAAGTVKALTECTDKAVEFEQQMSDVKKYVNGLADSSGKASDEMASNGKTFAENYDNMADSILQLSTIVPYTSEDLTRLAAAAGQSGKSIEDILSGGFLRDVAMWGSAMDVSADQAGNWAAKWEKAFNMDHSEIMVLADQINYLGANTATTAAEIAQCVNDAASLGQVAGVDVSTTAALADAMLATGVSTNKVGTSVKRIYTNMMKGSSATKAMKEQWAALGLTAEGVAKSMIQDSTGTMLTVFRKIGELDQDKQVAALSTLFGQWAIEGAAKITGNMSVFTDALAMVNDPSLYTGSMEREFTIKSDTAEAAAGMAQSAKEMFMIHIGDQFLDVQKQLDFAWRDFYVALDENIPQLKELAGALADLASNGLTKLSNAVMDFLPYVSRFLNSLGFSGKTTAESGEGTVSQVATEQTTEPQEQTPLQRIQEMAAPKIHELLEYIADNGPRVVDFFKKAVLVLVGFKLSPLLSVGANIATTGVSLAGSALGGLGGLILGSRVGGSVAGGAATRQGGLLGLFRGGQNLVTRAGNAVTAAQTGAATAVGAGGSRWLGGFLGLGNIANITSNSARRRAGATNAITNLIRGNETTGTPGVGTLRQYLGNRFNNTGLGRFVGGMGTNLRGIGTNLAQAGGTITSRIGQLGSFIGGGLAGPMATLRTNIANMATGGLQGARTLLGNAGSRFSNYIMNDTLAGDLIRSGRTAATNGIGRLRGLGARAMGGLNNARLTVTGLGMMAGQAFQNSRVGNLLGQARETIGWSLQNEIGPAVSGLFGNVRAFGARALPVLGSGVSSIGSGLLGLGGNALNIGGNVLGMAGTAWGPVAGMFGSLVSGAVPVVAAISGIIAVVSILGDHFEDIRTLIGNIFGQKGLQIFDTFTGKISGIGDTIKNALGIETFMDIFNPDYIQQAMGNLKSNLMFGSRNLFGVDFSLGLGQLISGLTPIVQSIMGIIGQIVTFANTTVKPIIENILGFIVNTVAPKILSIFQAVAPTVGAIITGFGNGVMSVMGLIGDVINAVLPIVEGFISKFLDVASVVLPVVLDAFNTFVENISPIIENVRGVFQGIIDFITGVFTGNWEQAWNGVKDIFKNVFEGLQTFIKTPLNAVIKIVNKVIEGVNNFSFTFPDWVPFGLGGTDFSPNIPKIPLLAKGGFTNGPSIAGEAGREAVISFDRSARAANIATWKMAGQMLGIRNQQVSLKDIPEENESGNKPTIVYAPNITIQGNANREDIDAAMEMAYQKFVANFSILYDKMERDRMRRAYA